MKLYVNLSIWIFFFSFGISSNLSYAQNNRNEAKKDTLNFGPEKLYLQFDKSTYIMPDTIWFKAYLVNASTLDNTGPSGLIHTELINESGQIVANKAFNTILGVTWGSYKIEKEQISAGNYTFRAYTNWMQNFGSEFFFTKKIVILNADTTKEVHSKQDRLLIKPTIPKISKIAEINRKVDIQFLPEGGNLLLDKPQRIGFKAIAGNGKGFPIAGSVYTEQGDKVIDFKSNTKGMGYFNMVPKDGISYVAKIIANQENYTVSLPKATNVGASLIINNRFKSDSIGVRIFSELKDQEIAIVAKSRGIVYYSAVLQPNIKITGLMIPKKKLPSGVCQIALLDAAGKMLNERAFFINHHDQLKISAEQNFETYKPRDKISLNIKISDNNNEPVASAFSVAVTDDGLTQKDGSANNILSYLLLSSDLKGYIENPISYFENDSEQTHNDLEALMLTQGWVKYDWQPLQKAAFKPEKTYTITGNVINGLNKPYANAKVSLMNHKSYVFANTLTNQEGRFRFDQFPPIDKTALNLRALNSNDKKGSLAIRLDEFKTPAFKANHTENLNMEVIPDSIMIYKQQELNYLEGIGLKTVEIKGVKKVEGSKNLNGSGIADLVLDKEMIDKDPKQSVIDLLRRNVKGFNARVPKTKLDANKGGYNAMISNPVDLNKPGIINQNIEYHYQNFYLKFIIDGVDLDINYDPFSNPQPNQHFNFINEYLDQYMKADDIKGIELMFSPSTVNRYRASYTGTSSDIAFLEITTKSGSGPFIKKYANVISLQAQPYGERRVFYSPVYTPENFNSAKPDLRSTVFWQPNLVTGDDGLTNFSFNATDRKGTYTVLLEGTDMLGHFGYKTMTLKID
jgi:hypothetical protein